MFQRGACLVAIAVAALLGLAATAQAECVSSTPTALAANSDLSGDNAANSPDITELVASLDAECRLLVRPVLLPIPILDSQLVVVYFDLNGDDIADVQVEMDSTGPILYTATDTIPLPPYDPSSPSQFTVTLDELGVATSPASIGMYVESYYLPDPITSVFGDEHPVFDQPLLQLPVTFASPPPPQPPAPVTPAGPTAKPPVVVQPKQATGCVVPKLKGLTVKKAKAALKKAGCKYKLKGKGRVRTASPKAGTRTAGNVQVKAKQKKGKKRRR